MRVTFVLPFLARRPVGGIRVIYEYANRLAERGHDVKLIHATHLRRLRLDEESRAISWTKGLVKRVTYPLVRPRPRWQSIHESVGLEYAPDLAAGFIPDADAVFATAWQTADYVAGYPDCKGSKFYLVQDFGPWLGPTDQIETTWREPFFKVTVSGWLYKKVVGATGSDHDIVTIPVAVDHDIYRVSVPLRSRGKRVTMMWGITSYKTPEIGLEAISIAKGKHPDLDVAIFGPVAQRPKGLPSWMQYRGGLSNAAVARIYNESQVFVCSSVAEGFALPPAEAMACGCAVASTDCGGIREYAEHQINALLSPVGDPKVLAANIVRLLDDSGLQERIALAGLQRIKDFTWKRSTDLLEAVLQERTRRNTEASR